MLLSLDRDSLSYTPFFCEENIWKLCETIESKNSNYNGLLDECHVVFISNEARSFPLWNQKLGKESHNNAVIWDYHVIMVVKHSEKCHVYDFDTILDFPVDFKKYLGQVIVEHPDLKREFRRLFRVIKARDFLTHFASNRSHMLDSNGLSLKPLPDYPAIRTASCDDNIQDYISMSEDNLVENYGPFGEVMDIGKFKNKFS